MGERYLVDIPDILGIAFLVSGIIFYFLARSTIGQFLTASNITKIIFIKRLPRRAIEALALLLAILVVALLFLVPRQSLQGLDSRGWKRSIFSLPGTGTLMSIGGRPMLRTFASVCKKRGLDLETAAGCGLDEKSPQAPMIPVM